METSIKEKLRRLSTEERKKLFPAFSAERFEEILRMSDDELMTLLKGGDGKNFIKETLPKTKQKTRWFDQPLCGLSEDGEEHLRELTQMMSKSESARLVDRKQIRYLKQLKKMQLTVPDTFRKTVNPKEFYQHLIEYCGANDIPEEIVGRVIPALVSYIETGHLRPILFVGEKGCGKTTAIRLLVQEALSIPTEVIKIPQTDGGRGLTGDSPSYQSSDVGLIAKSRLRTNSLLVSYVFDEIDKATHGRNVANIDDQLLSVTDESNRDIYDNFLETTLIGLEYCPMFMTANELEKVSPVLADRCTVIRFSNASVARIQSISHKYVDKKLNDCNLYSLIQFNYDMMDCFIEKLVCRNITSIRKHQQLIEAVFENALNLALTQKTQKIVSVTEQMFIDAEASILDVEKRRVGF